MDSLYICICVFLIIFFYTTEMCSAGCQMKECLEHSISVCCICVYVFCCVPFVCVDSFVCLFVCLSVCTLLVCECSKWLHTGCGVDRHLPPLKYWVRGSCEIYCVG